MTRDCNMVGGFVFFVNQASGRSCGDCWIPSGRIIQYNTALSSCNAKSLEVFQRFSKVAAAVDDLAMFCPDAQAYSCNNVAGALGGLMFAGKATPAIL